MARPPKPRTAADYHQALASVLGQVSADTSLQPDTRTAVLRALSEALTALQAEMTGR